MWFLKAVKVDSDAEWNRHLVSPGVPLAYRARAVVHTVGDVVHREGLADRLDQGGEVRVVGEGQQGALEGGDDRRQGEVCPLLITFPDLETR